VRRKPYSVVLLDEIEKAHPDVFNILLQVLDDGRLTDNKGRIANFKNTIVIMTSNLGSEIIREQFENITESNSDEISERTQILLMENLRRSLKPEFLNRIDETIMFSPLSKRDVIEIIKLQFQQIQEMLQKQNIQLFASDEVLNKLASIGFDPQFGARPIKRMLQKEVVNKLSKEILSGRVKPGNEIVLDEFDGEFVFRQTVKELDSK
jgi:ATP-dependent Clp protease ATP-binding subunit ClpB